MVQISIIGAGSVVFTGRLTVDLCLTKGLHGGTVILMDIDRERLDNMYNLATRYVKETGANLEFRKTTDRRKALEGADFVINTVKVGGYEPMETERKIAEKHGYYRGIGERVSDYYGGVGAYHQLKFFLDLARDIEDTSPEAWLIQASNPVFEGVNLVSRETRVKVVGVCHGHLGYLEVLKQLKLERDDVNVTVAGFNHNVWLSRFLLRNEDAYPILDRWIETEAEGYWKSDEYLKGLPWVTEQMSPAAVNMYRMFGLFPLGDTVRSASPWWYHIDLRTKQKWYGPTGGFDSEIGWSMYLQSLKEVLERLRSWAKDPTTALTKVYPPIPSGEQHVPLMEAIADDKKTTLQLNVPNNGAIPGIPDDVVVEVPTVVDGTGVKALPVGRLPRRLMHHVLEPRMLRMEQILQAFLEGDRESLLLTIAEDRRTSSLEKAKALLEELLRQPWNLEAARHYK
ncbi:MAG: family 4 glycosyl hydrolase [Nitrososphaeria archaeon]